MMAHTYHVIVRNKLALIEEFGNLPKLPYYGDHTNQGSVNQGPPVVWSMILFEYNT